MFAARSLARVGAVLAVASLLAASVMAQSDDTPTRRPPREGRGEDELVLIHGLGTDTSVWDDMLPYVKGMFQVWTYELHGHGSTPPLRDPSIAAEAEALDAWLDANDIVYPVIVGHAMGGMIALQYTLDHPADVRRLILIDAGPKQIASDEEKAAVGQALIKDYDRFVATRFAMGSTRQDIVDKVVDLALRTDSTTMASLMLSSFDWDVSDRLATLSVPMLLLGSDNYLPEPGNERGYLTMYGFGKVRDLKFKRLAGVGHYAMLESPTQVAAAILVFGHPDD